MRIIDFNLEDLDERLISPDKITTLDSNDHVKIQENTRHKLWSSGSSYFRHTLNPSSSYHIN